MLQFFQRVQSKARKHNSNPPKLSRAAVVGVTEKHARQGMVNGINTVAPRSTPKIENQYHDDVCFARILDSFLAPEVKERAHEELETLGEDVVSEQMLNWVAEAERSPPKVEHWDAWGEIKDELVTSNGWEYLWQFGISQRLNALPSLTKEYGGQGRIIQMLKSHLFAASSASCGLHFVLSDGVAILLARHLRESKIDPGKSLLFQNAYDHLTSSEEGKAWASGLWLTERGGGSDLTPTETTATFVPLSADDSSKDADGFPLGPWVLNGQKWFSTGTEPGMAIALARTPKGLSAFYVPMRRAVMVDGSIIGTELNGVRIRRLKMKMGLKPLATAELEMNGVRAWLVGKEGKGINEIGTILNVSRIYIAVGAIGYAGRALAASRAFARVRKVARGTRLSSLPLHMKSLAKAHVTYRAQMTLVFFVTSLLAASELPEAQTSKLDLVPKRSQDVLCLLRLLGSVCKAHAALDTCHIIQVSVESLGGVGYLENEDMGINIARLWRDAASFSIGEGTTGVLAADTVKVMKGRIGTYVVSAMSRWVKSSLPEKQSMTPEAAIVSQEWSELQMAISSNGMDYLTMNGREIMERVCKITCGVLLLADAARDDDPIAMEVARRWIRPTMLLNGSSVEQELMIDQQIVFGNCTRWQGLR